jgi:hypothetical protein
VDRSYGSGGDHPRAVPGGAHSPLTHAKWSLRSSAEAHTRCLPPELSR